MDGERKTLQDESARSWLCVPAPMPRFKRNPVRIVARITEPKTETRGMGNQPRKCRGTFELFLERGKARRRHVERAAGVVLAVAGRGTDPQDLIDRLAAGKLPPQQIELIRGAAKRRYDVQFDAVAGRGGAHPLPGARGARGEPLIAPLRVTANVFDATCFAHAAQSAGAPIILRNTERARCRSQLALRRAGTRDGRSGSIEHRRSAVSQPSCHRVCAAPSSSQ